MGSNVDVIVYNGIKFRRYPNSCDFTAKNYYTPHIEGRKMGVESLHREIWKSHCGVIPKGYNIHHKNNNPLDNSIENLECISRADHTRHHLKEYYTDDKKEKAAAHLKKFTVKAHVWTKTDAGKKILSENWKSTIGKMGKQDKVCSICLITFQSYSSKKAGLLCSSKCRMIRRQQRIESFK